MVTLTSLYLLTIVKFSYLYMWDVASVSNPLPQVGWVAYFFTWLNIFPQD